MIISPCAMLMTPITPKVMARPMAASSSTRAQADSLKQVARQFGQHQARVDPASKAVGGGADLRVGSANVPSGFVAAGCDRADFGGQAVRQILHGCQPFDQRRRCIRLNLASVRVIARTDLLDLLAGERVSSRASGSAVGARHAFRAAASRLAGSGRNSLSLPTAAPTAAQGVLALMRVRSTRRRAGPALAGRGIGQACRARRCR